MAKKPFRAETWKSGTQWTNVDYDCLVKYLDRGDSYTSTYAYIARELCRSISAIKTAVIKNEHELRAARLRVAYNKNVDNTKPKNHGRPWTMDDVLKLKQGFNSRTHPTELATALNRTTVAVLSKLTELQLIGYNVVTKTHYVKVRLKYPDSYCKSMI